MARINSHINYGAEYKNASAEARNSERVAEVNRNLTDLKSDILRLKIMVQAMMEIMVEQGIDPERINAKIDEIVSRPETFNPTMRASMPCPRCGKNIIDNGNTPLTGTCLYCGTVVRFPPHFDLGNKNGQPQDPTLEPALGHQFRPRRVDGNDDRVRAWEPEDTRRVLPAAFFSRAAA